MFHKIVDKGEAGDNLGLLLKGLTAKDVRRGMVISQPGYLTPHNLFDASVYILTESEGGRKHPFFAGFQPQFFFHTADVTGIVNFLDKEEKVLQKVSRADRKKEEGVKKEEMAMPGDHKQVQVKLIAPMPLREGLKFAIREGNLTIGAGVVSKVRGLVAEDGEEKPVVAAAPAKGAKAAPAAKKK